MGNLVVGLELIRTLFGGRLIYQRSMVTKFQHDYQEILYPAFAFRKGESASIQEDFWMVDPNMF